MTNCKAPDMARASAALLREARTYLEARDVPEAGLNAEHLLACVLGKSLGELRAAPDGPVESGRRRRFWGLVRRRGGRLPLSYVLGTQAFMDLELKVGPGVLTPRPETEELVRAVLSAVRAECAPSRVLDVGTGSGCIAIALARAFPGARIWATDISPRALFAARENSRRHGVARRIRFLRRDLFSSWRLPGAGPGPWADLVVSNPPYVPSGRIPSLEPEVLAEPRLALDGGPDGLDAVRAVTARALGILNPGGLLALEIDEGQGRAVRLMMRGLGFRSIRIRRDLGGLQRLALGQAPSGK